MFGISWSEIFVVFVVALVVTKPEDYPKIIKAFKEIINNLNAWKKEASKIFNEVTKESELKNIKDDINKQIKQIVDLEGNLQEAYDISDLEDLRAKDKVE